MDSSWSLMAPRSSKPREDRRAPVAARRLRAREEERGLRQQTRRVADSVAPALPQVEPEAAA